MYTHINHFESRNSDILQVKTGELLIRTYYGGQELIQFSHRVGRGWAVGYSLTWPGVVAHFDLRNCRRPRIF